METKPRHLLYHGIRAACVLAFAWLALGGGLPASGAPSAAPASLAVTWPTLTLRLVASDLDKPVSVTHAGDGSNRLFIVNQSGAIRILQNGNLLATPFLNVSSLVSCCGERGLLGLAFPPNYASRNHFYIFYTNTNGNLVIARYNASSNPNLADPNSGVIVVTVPHPGHSNHNGGQLAFGPDGYLYAGLGDGGGGGDPNGNGQNLNVLLAKLLRLDVEGAGCVQNPPKPQNYCIPPGNPFVSTAGARPEIWAYGLRNPWRFSFDRANGDLYIADVGQGAVEEVDFQAAGWAGGANYGWNEMEGNRCYPDGGVCAPPAGYVAPVTTYDHSDFGGCSITGGSVYRGPDIFLNMQGVYFYGDFCTGDILGLVNSGGWQAQRLLKAPFMISTFGEDESGFLYVADHSGGKLYQVLGELDPAALPQHTLLPVIRK